METKLERSGFTRQRGVDNTSEKEGIAMKGSITFKFSGDPNNYCVHISKEGELDSGDLQVIVTLLEQDIKLSKGIASGEITPTPSDPTGVRQLHNHWSN